VGISILGKYRICTENSLFAMPETGIGLFPDVGSTFFLNQLKGGLGHYLALSGARLNYADLMYSGLATHFIPSSQVDAMIQDLSRASQGERASSPDWIDDVLMSHHVEIPTNDCYLAQNQKQIDEIFGGKRKVEEIVSSLNTRHDNVFARETLQTLKKMSPTSLKVTLEGLIRGQQYQDIGESLKMEFRMSQAFMKDGSDFYEGIRATLIDKDKSPKWCPVTLEELHSDDVVKYFDHLGDNELTFDHCSDQSKL
jgi:enoyl-CoA hydratase/carnithine racemase